MRDYKIDTLRFIGLAAIILAHTSPPSFIFQLRNFDVPLMVFISGLSFSISYKNENFLSYLFKRAKRLIAPVWIFLTLYFGIQLLGGIHFEALSLRKILESYFFLDGIGYVWIIRIFLIMAIVAPLINRMLENLDNASFFSTVILLLLISEVAIQYSLSLPLLGKNSIIGQFLWYVVPYSVLLSLGMRIPKLTEKMQAIIAFSSLLVFLSIALLFYFTEQHFVPTQLFKYPPRLYYLSYAVAVTLFIYLLLGPLKKLILGSTLLSKSITFISQNSIWIYLWHIPFIKGIDASFEKKYAFTFIAATVITFIQVSLINYINQSDSVSSQTKRNLKIMLTG